ncbi:hypothetical protein DBV05_g2102 [Lasiodiplodia theobromae]|uniref:DUF7907 domain-containing protein n=1 Tax=Lasiodiplodia theobromae TaxID=45133 RepID=A0A5N5DMH5_9PEZI|nr:hypothetical protein DBV05_g2102 [Lasiodiplodia theobromae]
MFNLALTSTLLLPALALAAPTTSTNPTLSTSKSIKLVANVLGSFDLSPSVNSYELNPFELAGGDMCNNALGLSPSGYGALWRSEDGTLYTIQSGNGWAQKITLNIQPGGSATVPAARAIGVQCGAGGTEGVTVIPENGNGNPLLEYGRDTSGWMACPSDMLNANVPADEGAVVVGYRDAGQRILSGCAEVEFVAYCAEDDGSAPGAMELPCVVSA